ncbi:hypothetical protein Pryu01_01260 [Paraliobacillus ryukyuensis]|uniref:Uncharacterized protein n=1 Tax=Paraliobacillus ryukyuensis TaxID=200904 RepID=A0A366EAW6_9BACI|nr:hypothetical protein [Paraliobacillus ryukyuensis]RBO99506.1 hypothetical protein DES48_104182 [Paraliobacillus ryukyuensis]
MIYYQDLIDRMDGYRIGTTVVENGEAYLATEDGRVDLNTYSQIEIQTYDDNGIKYHEITYEEMLHEKTPEGWPLFAGFYARVKGGEQ